MAFRPAQYAALLLGSLTLSACARSPAENLQERSVIQNEDPFVAAMDEATNTATAAGKSGRKTPSKPHQSDVPRVDTTAPKLSPAELRQRILRLTAGLQSAADTEAERVSQLLGVSFTSELMSIREGESIGDLEQVGSYRVSVSRIDRTSPGKHVRISFGPAGFSTGRPSICTFELVEFADALRSQGYDAGEVHLPHREQWGFVRYVSASDLTFYVSAELYRANDGTRSGKLCLADVTADAVKGRQ